MHKPKLLRNYIYIYRWFIGIPVFVSEQPENKLEDLNYKIRAEDM